MTKLEGLRILYKDKEKILEERMIEIKQYIDDNDGFVDDILWYDFINDIKQDFAKFKRAYSKYIKEANKNG